MTRRKQINLLHTILLIFLFIVPVCTAAFDKKAVLYMSLAVFCSCVGYRVYREGVLVVTKSMMLASFGAVISFVSMFFVSDKSNQLYFGGIFLLSAVLCMIISDYKAQMGEEALVLTFPKLIYTASLFYAIMTVLHQVFIESSFWGCNMDFGNGSSETTAVLMVLGIMCGLIILKTKKHKTGFFVAMGIMLYVFVMTKSFLGYLFASLCVLFYMLRSKKKKTEAFLSLVAVALLAVVNIVKIIAEIINKPEPLLAAIRGLVSITGIGYGGYNAIGEVLGKGYEGFGQGINVVIEALGIFGIVIIAMGIMGMVLCIKQKKLFGNTVVFIAACCVLLSSSAMFIFTIPILFMYYSAIENGIKIKVSSFSMVPCAAIVVFFLVLSSAYVPYALAQNAWDMGEFEKSADYYAMGASMELCNSEGWINAYLAEEKAYETLSEEDNRQIYIEKAIKFNGKNYKYRVYKANVYTSVGDYIAALEVWDDIIARHDKEYLYPEYAQSILDVMKNCPIGLEESERLYGVLAEYAKKPTDKDIILKVNNILSESQQYYVKSREGDADIYIDAEVENESGNPAS